jgi:hypothetical protein
MFPKIENTPSKLGHQLTTNWNQFIFYACLQPFKFVCTKFKWILCVTLAMQKFVIYKYGGFLITSKKKNLIPPMLCTMSIIVNYFLKQVLVSWTKLFLQDMNMLLFIFNQLNQLLGKLLACETSPQPTMICQKHRKCDPLLLQTLFKYCQYIILRIGAHHIKNKKIIISSK